MVPNFILIARIRSSKELVLAILGTKNISKCLKLILNESDKASKYVWKRKDKNKKKM